MAKNNNNHELFRLTTRRYIAFGLGGLATLGMVFAVIWSQITGTCQEMGMVALGGLIAIVSGIIGYFFGKKED